MHPVVILIPVAALIFAPRLWVNHVLRRHNGHDGRYRLDASHLARELLDRKGLQAVKVEITDIGDHYDPQGRAVRLARDKYGRRSLTALTTAAHEVAHALQHADGYGPFVWRTRLVKVAQVTGEAGSLLLLAVPAAALITRNPVPPMVIGVAALSMLGTGVAAQLAALPSELDASFQRALPMLRAGYVDASQMGDARQILFACSLTYIASSLVAVLNVWPWVGRGRYLYRPSPAAGVALLPAGASTGPPPKRHAARGRPREAVHTRRGERHLRRLLKPLIRAFLSLER
jgi:Zn-dependent membrane protease YugP